MFTDLSIHWLPLFPTWLVALVGTALVVLLVYGSLVLLRRQVPGRWVAFLGGWRLAIIAVFVLVLLQPVVSFTKPADGQPEMIVLVDASQSMGLPGRDSTPRLAELTPLLEKGDFASALRDRYRLHWYAFDGAARPLVKDGLTDLKPDGSTTRIADGLTAAWDNARAAGATPERVLLVSDGNDNGATDPVEVARRLGLVIDVLAPGSPPDKGTDTLVSIADVQSMRRILLGSEAIFRVSLRNTHGRGTPEPLTLHLLENGTEVWTGKVAFKPGSEEQRVPVTYRPTSAGAKKYEFRVSGPDAAETPYVTTVQVLDGKYELLILEDSWRWEFKYMRRVFEDDPSLRFTATLARGGGAFVQFGSADRRVNLVGFPQGRAELEEFDTIVLGDVSPQRWPRDLAGVIADMVTEQGKSLIVIAGPNVGHLAEMRELNALLPVELTRDAGNPQGGPIDVQVSADGLQSPFFHKSDRGDIKLPPLDQIYAPLRKKPGATVLLEAARKGNTYGNLIVMAEQTVGRGRVLYVGTDTLWHWQTLAGGGDAAITPYRTFWQQAMRAMTPARPSLAGVQVWLQPSRSRTEAGRPIRVRAEIDADRPLVRPVVQGSVLLPGDRELPLAFAANPNEPGVFTADFVTAGPGTYQIGAAVVSEGKKTAETTTTIDVEPVREEKDAVRVDHANLARIAAATGGQVIDPAKPETWPVGGPRTRQPAPEVKTVDLWRNFSLLLVLCGLLGVDWMLRLVRGYV